LSSKKHFNRYIKKAVRAALADTPVVFVMGARQTGKSTLVEELLDDSWNLVNLDNQVQLNLITSDPVGFMRANQDSRVAIDEIQRLPDLLLNIKQSVDANRKPGRFVLTGSANAMLLPKVADSLAGRIETILLTPLSECEIHDVKPNFLSHLTQINHFPRINCVANKNYLIQRVVEGCFPEPLLRSSPERAATWYKQYVNSLVQKDMRDLFNIDHPEKMLTLLKLTAYYSGKLINFSDLSNKVNLSAETIKKYIQLLEHLFLIRKLPAWHSNEQKRLVKTPKVHINDTGLSCAMRDIDFNYLINNPSEFGPLLETFVINELFKQSCWLQQDLSFYHYRDKSKQEIDCIIENARGESFAIEVKASATISAKDFKTLQNFRDTEKEKFRMGVLLYDGEEVIPFGEKLFAVPIYALWEGKTDCVTSNDSFSSP
jgi:uncharacterized protein